MSGSTLYKASNDHQEQGIVSILSSDFNSNTQKRISSPNSNYSIRRTFSADMSSKKWLNHNGFKRVQSSEQLQQIETNDNNTNNNNNNNSAIGEPSNNRGRAFEDIWSSIQSDKGSWSSILSPQKNDGSGSGSGSGSGLGSGSRSSGLPPPYVHPLVKRSSSLNEKSLEICTESLGSETGSDGFSSYPSSELGDSDKNSDNNGEVVVHEEEVGKYNYTPNKSVHLLPLPPPRSFPPPLPSLALRDGSNLHMTSRRDNGRLVLEAVSVPSQNCLRAHRRDGRLLLTLAAEDTTASSEYSDSDDDDVEFEEEEEQDEDQQEEEGGELAIVMEETSRLPRAMINLQMNKQLMGLLNTRNKSTWPRNFNSTVAQIIPAPETASAATAAALNAYEYYWRRNNHHATAAMAVLKPIGGGGAQENNDLGGVTVSPQLAKDIKSGPNTLVLAHKGKCGEQQEVVLVKAGANWEKGEYLVPLLRGCKEPKRSLLFLEPYCIATT